MEVTLFDERLTFGRTYITGLTLSGYRFKSRIAFIPGIKVDQRLLDDLKCVGATIALKIGDPIGPFVLRVGFGDGNDSHPNGKVHLEGSIELVDGLGAFCKTAFGNQTARADQVKLQVTMDPLTHNAGLELIPVDSPRDPIGPFVLRVGFGDGNDSHPNGKVRGYLYVGDLTAPKENALVGFELYEAGHKYGIHSLETTMEGILLGLDEDLFSSDVALRLFLFVKDMDRPQLKTKSVQLLKLKCTELKELPGYLNLFKEDNLAVAMELVQCLVSRRMLNAQNQ